MNVVNEGDSLHSNGGATAVALIDILKTGCTQRSQALSACYIVVFEVLVCCLADFQNDQQVSVTYGPSLWQSVARGGLLQRHAFFVGDISRYVPRLGHFSCWSIVAILDHCKLRRSVKLLSICGSV
jgi:hypothetical protein